MKLNKTVKTIVRFFCFLVFIAISGRSFAQLKGISYQAVAIDESSKQIPGLDNSGAALIEKTIGLRFTILNGSNGPIYYQETQITSTDKYGLFSVVIGDGTLTAQSTRSVISDIPWSTGNQFLRVELDLKDAGDFKIMSNQQFMAVPYAFYALNTNTNSAPSITLTVLGNSLNVSGGNTVVLPIAATASLVSSGAAVTTSLGSNSYSIHVPQPTLSIVNSNLSISGGNTVSLPAATPQTITAQGIASATNGINSATVTVPNPTLTISGTNLSVSGGNTITLPTAAAQTISALGIASVTNGINSATLSVPNPTLSIIGSNLSVSGGNTITLPSASPQTITTQGIATVTNGINSATVSVPNPTLTLNGNNLSVSGGNTVTIPSYNDSQTLSISGNTISIANGNSISLPSASAWGLTGNAGTASLTNFIGTTDNVPLMIRVNNQASGRIDIPNTGITFFGYQSGFSNSSGVTNTGNGFQTLKFTTTGGANTANGSQALLNNTTGSFNTATGKSALINSISGSNNSAFGGDALAGNTLGDGNAAFGMGALSANTSGYYNTAIGTFANVGTGTLTYAAAIGANAKVLRSNSIVLGDTLNNILVGIGTGAPTQKLDVRGVVRIVDGTQGLNKVLTSDANGNASWQAGGSSNSWGLTGNAGTTPSLNFIGTTDNKVLKFRVNNQMAGLIDNSTLACTFFGYQAGNINNTGTNNTAMGYQAFSSNTSGIWNTAVGYRALPSSNVGNGNTAIGYLALQANSSGNQNTALGNAALNNNTTANWNVAIGAVALTANTTGSNNTTNGSWALYTNSIGNNNTAMGYQSLGNNTSGNNNTALGFGTDVATGTLNNATAIGANVIVSVSNNMVFGNAAVIGWGFGVAAGTAALRVGSSASNGNGALLTTAGVWTNASDSTKKFNIKSINYGLKEVLTLRPVSYKMKGSNYQDIGFIAQEVKQVLPELVYGKEGEMTLSYGQLTAVLTKAMQEQQLIIEKQKNDLERLEKYNEQLTTRLLKISQEIEVIKQAPPEKK